MPRAWASDSFLPSEGFVAEYTDDLTPHFIVAEMKCGVRSSVDSVVTGSVTVEVEKMG